MRLAFIWQGLDGQYGVWADGLAAAMKLIEKEHDVRYFDTTRISEIHDFKPNVVLYWEAPITLRGENAHNYQAVLDLPYRKALLFAGGPVRPDICYGFDLYFVESKVNEEDFEALKLPWKRAFGVNTQVFKPIESRKVYDGFLHATFAAWKRQDLFADALGDRGAVAGRTQETDMAGYRSCIEKKVDVWPNLRPELVNMLINKSHTVVNTAALWGGGQRCTLEAMACGVPVIVMNDSPKNCEYVQESGGGEIVEPNAEAINRAIDFLKNQKTYSGTLGRQYVESKWTEQHYATALLEGINQII